jgi:hypothetical protein
MPKTYKNSEYDFNEKKFVEGTKDLAMRMFMPHNKTDDGRISLSDMYSADNKDLISDLFSQLINGTADVEKDAWIFFIQGNMEIAPMLLMMFKAGVPKDYAVKFVSQPLIREYAKEQRLLGSSYADLTADELTKVKGSKQYKAAFNVLSKFGVDSAESYIKGNNYHTAVTKLTEKSGILNKDGEFDSRLLDKILNEPENPALRGHQLAIFMHFIELEKQFSGFQDLMRLANPDTTTSKTTQEMLLRNVLLNELEGSSKIEKGLVNKLRKESILNTFYDNKIITDLIEPLFPLKNNKYISNSIVNYLINARSKITTAFGTGDDGRRFFITNFKNGLVNSIFQNTMFNYNEATQAALNIPSELISKYFTGDVFFQNTDYSFADDLLQIIEQNPELKEKYSILNQISKPELKDGQQVITLNDNKLLKDGQLAEAYYENLKNLADPNVEKVEDTEKNLYISNMFKVLPLMAIYQNGVGYSKYGFNEALPFDDFLAVTEPASVDFLNNSLNQNEMDNIFNKLIDPKNKFFRNYINITPAQATVRPAQPSTSVNEFDIADSLTPIEQNFKDGDGGRQMQPQFKDKSTMDLIISGNRTRTTRAKTDIQRMAKDYKLSKISDLVGKVVRMTDKTGRQVYTRITKVAQFTQEYQDATWQKEGWVKSVTDKLVGNYPYAIEFEVVNKSTQSSTQPSTSVDNTNKPILNSLPNKSSNPTMTYAGIGSRQTPQEVLDKMTEVAKYLDGLGYTLQTGFTFKNKETNLDEEGADKAFSDGSKNKTLFGPYGIRKTVKGIVSADKYNEAVTEKSSAIVKEVHPAPDRLTPGAIKLMARNTNQIFGKNLDNTVDFVIFYAPETSNPLRPKGGTGQAVEMARRKGIPTINMADTNWRAQLKTALATQPSTQPATSPTVNDSINESELPVSDGPVYTFGSKSLQEQLDILSSPEFTDWYSTELLKNPNLDAAEALDYYIKCKGL